MTESDPQGAHRGRRKWNRTSGLSLASMYMHALEEMRPLFPALVATRPCWKVWGQVTVTHRLNYTMYCDVIRKKDEVTEQISTRSSAWLCALRHCSPSPNTHIHTSIIITQPAPPRALPFPVPHTGFLMGRVAFWDPTVCWPRK